MQLRRRAAIRRALRTFRATVGLSQMAVAERVGVSERRYWFIENGYKDPTDAEVAKLAKVLKTDTGKLPWPGLLINQEPQEQAS